MAHVHWLTSPVSGIGVIKNPTSGDTYQLLPAGSGYRLEGIETDSTRYWILPDGHSVPQSVLLAPPVYPTVVAAEAALAAHWDTDSHGHLALPPYPQQRITEVARAWRPGSGGLTEAFVDVIGTVLVHLLSYLVPRIMAECTPENVDELLHWAADPAHEEAIWQVVRAGTVAGSAGILTPLLLGSGGRAQLHRVLDYLRTPEGRRIAQRALSQLCAGGRAITGIRSPQVTPGAGTRLAQRVERCACMERLSCAHADTGRQLRELDRPWAVERLPSAPVRTIRKPTVNAGRMWQLATTSLYKGDDLISVAVREAAQNAVDNLRPAMRSGRVAKGTGTFEVTWDEDAGTITFADNGTGMDEDTFVNKFMELGAEGKTGEQNQDAAGGFGMAKAVLLGVSPTWRWEIRSQGWIHRTVPGTLQYETLTADTFARGVSLTVFDIKSSLEHSDLLNGYYSVEDRIKLTLGYFNIPDVTFKYNGQIIEPALPGRRGSVLSYPLNWGTGVDVQIKGYKRADTKGAIVVRLNDGIFQFATYGVTGLRSDIVLEVKTKIKAGNTGYPLPPSRDSFRGPAEWAMYNLRKTLEREAKSGDEDREYDDFLPESTNPEERKGAEAFDAAMQDAMDDPRIQELLQGIQEAAAALFIAEVEDEAKDVRREVESTTPAQDRGAEAEDPFSGWRTAAAVLPSGEEALSTEGRQAFVAAVDAVVQANPEGVRGTFYAGSAAEAGLGKIESGEPLTWEEGTALVDLIQQAGEMPTASGTDGGSGIGRAATQTQMGGILVQIMAKNGSSTAAVEAVKKKAKASNPFGAAAMVKVSRKNFDKDRAKKFMRSPKRWIPHLVAWESVLHLVHRAGNITIPYKPGYVLDDTVNAVAFGSGESGVNRRNYVLVNPFKLDVYLQAHAEHALSIANWLLTIACHELSHLPHMGKGHGEAFMVEREGLQLNVGFLLPAVEQIIVRVFKLKDPDKLTRKRIRDGRKRLQERLTKAERHIQQLEAANARDLREQRDLPARTTATFGDAPSWPATNVVRTLTLLGRAEALAAWALSPAGLQALGERAVPLARSLQNPTEALRLTHLGM